MHFSHQTAGTAQKKHHSHCTPATCSVYFHLGHVLGKCIEVYEDGSTPLIYYCMISYVYIIYIYIGIRAEHPFASIHQRFWSDHQGTNEFWPPMLTPPLRFHQTWLAGKCLNELRSKWRFIAEKIIWLVVDLPLWKNYEFVSWDDEIPNISPTIYIYIHITHISSHTQEIVPLGVDPIYGKQIHSCSKHQPVINRHLSIATFGPCTSAVPGARHGSAQSRWSGDGNRGF